MSTGMCAEQMWYFLPLKSKFKSGIVSSLTSQIKHAFLFSMILLILSVNLHSKSLALCLLNIKTVSKSYLDLDQI